MKKKSLGLAAAISIGLGGMIGAGIFSIIGVAANISGTALYLSFLIGGFIALLSTYSFAKLSITYPSAGGPVEFIVKGFGNNIFSGSLNILLWLGYIFALALYARAFGGYAMTFLSASADPIWQNVLITAVIVFFTAINSIGSRVVGDSEKFIVGIKVLILIGFVIIGVFFIEPSRIKIDEYPQPSSILHGAVIVFIAYEGFGLVTNAAEDIKQYKKNLPRALFYSVIITMLIYVAISFVVTGNLSIPAIVEARDHALAKAAEPFLGQIGFKVVTIAALFSIASAINATLYGAANVSYMNARTGHLPERFDRKIWQSSKEGLFITSFLVLVAANFIDLSGIAMLGSCIFLLIYGMVNVGHLKLTDETEGNKFVIWLAIFACFISFVLLIQQTYGKSPITILILVGVVGSSFLIEVVYRGITKRRMESDPMETEEEKNLWRE